jgi:BlaI family transcriptional regulator, penicillinase repressor
MPTHPPSEREFELLKVLWKLRAATVRQVLDELAPKGQLAFNTIQTQLRIMEDKGLVRHRAEGRTFIYQPVYTREQASSRFLQKVFDGAVRDLVMTLLRSRKLKTEEIEALEELIAEARQSARAKTPKEE